MNTERLTLNVPEACSLLGISPSVGYRLIKRGEFPVETLKLGRRVVVPEAKLRRLLVAEEVPVTRTAEEDID